MSDVKCLLRGGEQPLVGAGGGMPRGTHPAAIEARQNIADFLSVTLPKPLWFTSQQIHNRNSNTLDTMTPAERVYLEIEMQAQATEMHSSDYDPLRSS